MAVDPNERKAPAEVERAFQEALALDPAGAALVLANIANRATAELHKLGRAQANQQRGTEIWGRWAALANSARDAVMKTSQCRERAGELAGKAPRERRAPAASKTTAVSSQKSDSSSERTERGTSDTVSGDQPSPQSDT
ncbi:MAG: hypothetical protein HY329_09875 [Chloroflexi bacterium]|nr:hypothetical protein [Chloroflexota bacterium]